MNPQPKEERVLITVMTYPHPSKKDQEVVCTAGITQAGDWVRLYPVDYRYRPTTQRFHKYQWIRVLLEDSGSGNDKRLESRKPHLDSMVLEGEPLSTKNSWAARRAIIDSMPEFTVRQLEALHAERGGSLGIVRPKRVLDLIIELTDGEWKPEWRVLYQQLPLFGPPPKPLRKLPYKFRYVFECEDDEKPRTVMIEDWELGALFLGEAARLGSDEAAAESVKKKFLDELCAPDRDTRFFMGTRFPYNTWLVVGVFWPPKLEPSLFD